MTTSPSAVTGALRPTSGGSRRLAPAGVALVTLATVAAAVVVAGVHGPGAATATTTTVSSSSTGVVGNARSSLVDARPGFVTFDSVSTNLVGGATSGVPQTYLKNTASGALTLLSVQTGGAPSVKGSTGIGFSPDGTEVLFVARDGVTGGSAGPQAYVRRLSDGVVTLVSGTGTTGTTGTANTGLAATGSSLSADGTKVAFAVRGTTFGAGWQVLVKNLTTGTLTLASVTSQGAPVAATSTETPPHVAFSPDGASVYFDSDAAKVTPSTPPGQVYRRDLAAGTTTVVSVDPTGKACKGTLRLVLATGRVVFDSPGICAPGAPRAKGAVFVTGAGGAPTTVVSATAAGVAADDLSTAGAASPNGTRVAFTSVGKNLGPAGVAANSPQVYVKDLASGTLTWASPSPTQQLGRNVGYTRTMEFDPSGTKLVFPSAATNIVSPSPSTDQNVFQRDLTAAKTTALSVSAAGAPVRSPFARYLDATHVAFTDDLAGQVLLRTLP